MTFDEWLDIRIAANNSTVGVLEELKLAWNAGYEQGVSEVEKTLKHTRETMLDDINNLRERIDWSAFPTFQDWCDAKNYENKV